MALRAVGTLLLALGLFGMLAAGGVAAGTQLGQSETVDGDAGDRPLGENPGGGVGTVDSDRASGGPTDDAATSEGPDLQLASLDFPSTIAPDEDLTVNYTIENVGDDDGIEEFVDLLVDGTDSEFDDTDEDVFVPAGGTASGTLTFDNVSSYFGDSDVVSFSVELYEFGDSASGSTDVDDPSGDAEVLIQSLDYVETLPIGSALAVNYTLANVGDADGIESFVDLRVDGTDKQFDDTDQYVDVPAGGTTNGTLRFDVVGDYFDPGDTISFTVELWDFTDTVSGETTYELPDEPVLQLVSVDAPPSVDAGETLTVDYTIENIGGAAGTESAVDLLVDGQPGDTDANVTVPAQDSVSGSLTVENVSVGGSLTVENVGVGGSLALPGGTDDVSGPTDDAGERTDDVSGPTDDAGERTDDVSGPTDEGVQIAGHLRRANEPMEVIVEFAGAPEATTPGALQAHASDVQEPLASFAAATDGVTVENTLWLDPMALVEVDLGRVSVADLAGIEHVEAVRENPTFTIDTGLGAGVPTQHSDDATANGSYTYGLEQIDAPTAWETHDTMGEGASVAVLDTGVDGEHPDLDVAKWQEFDGDGNPVVSQPNDGSGHGTHVSGTVSGPVDPAGDVPAYGVAPAVDLYGSKILDDNGSSTLVQIVAGMEWAVAEGADVISMSLGANGTYGQWIEPVQNAQDAGTVVVASAGNSGEGASGSPANVYDSIAVGASNSVENIGDFSSGEVIDTGSDWDSPPGYWPEEYVVPTVAAPGVNVLSSVPGGGYDDAYIGTSMAAPHVSGAIALGLSASDANVTPELVEQALEFTAFKPVDAPVGPGERDTRYGSGIVDADALVEFLTDPPEGETVTYTVDLADTGDSRSDEVFVESDDPPGAAEFAVTITGVNTPVAGEPLDVVVGVENVGDSAGTNTVSAAIDGVGEDSTTAQLGAGESTDVTLTLGTEAQDAGEYTLTVETPHDSATATAVLNLPTLPGQDAPPVDTDGDGLYEDADGDAAFDIFDVLVLFESFDAELMDEYGWAFDFDDDGDVDIFDVQAMFAELAQQS